MKILPATGIAVVLISSNVLLGYYSAPSEILFTPFVVLITTILLIKARSQRLAPIISASLAALLICGNDIGVKLFGGGTHDLEGQGFITAALFLGLIPAYFFLLYQVLQQPSISPKRKIVACLVFPFIMTVHLFFFGWLGVTG